MKEGDRNRPEADRRRLAGLAPRLEARSRIVRAIRDHFAGEGFLEVETPLRVRAPAPERHIDAEPSGKRYLITSPELHMKRLLAAGYERIFQICRSFRRGERGDLHLPEFTMVEWYRLGAGIEEIMGDCEALLAAAERAAGADLGAATGCRVPDLSPPWERLEVSDAFERFAGWRPGAAPDAERFDRDLVEEVEPALPADRPIFLTGYPASMASLAATRAGDPARAERFELYAGGLELANGFLELTDPSEQRRRFEEENEERAAAGKERYPIDEAFLSALELGLAPCAGIALGVDRLVMLLTGARRIDEVVAFADEEE